MDLGYRPAVRTAGKELPTTHCSLSFLTSMRIVYCRINKLSTDNSSEASVSTPSTPITPSQLSPSSGSAVASSATCWSNVHLTILYFPLAVLLNVSSFLHFSDAAFWRFSSVNLFAIFLSLSSMSSLSLSAFSHFS